MVTDLHQRNLDARGIKLLLQFGVAIDGFLQLCAQRIVVLLHLQPRI